MVSEAIKSSHSYGRLYIMAGWSLKYIKYYTLVTRELLNNKSAWT